MQVRQRSDAFFLGWYVKQKLGESILCFALNPRIPWPCSAFLTLLLLLKSQLQS